jgi:hypothetical protein
MIEKRSSMVLFAVIAAIVIVAPISVYELTRTNPGINVTSSNTVTNVTFAVNFTRYTDSSIQFNPNYLNFSSVTVIDKNTLNLSTLEIDGMAFEFYSESTGWYFVSFNFSVNGNISPSIPPSSLLLTIQGSNYSNDNLFSNTFLPYAAVNTTCPQASTYYGPFVVHSTLALKEDSNLSSHYPYHFVFSDVLVIQIHPYYIHPTPFNVTIQAALPGYSTQVFDQVNFHVEDVG